MYPHIRSAESKTIVYTIMLSALYEYLYRSCFFVSSSVMDVCVCALCKGTRGPHVIRRGTKGSKEQRAAAPNLVWWPVCVFLQNT